MLSPRLTLLLVAAFLVFLNLSNAKLTARQTPSPQALKNEMQLRAVTQPEETTGEKAPAVPAAQVVATSTERIDRDRAEIRVYRNGKQVELYPSFHELVTATPANHEMGLDALVGRSIALVPSEKRAEQWDVFTGVGGIAGTRGPVGKLKADQWSIYTGVGGVGDLVLAGNIFKVRQVLLSSRKNPIEVRVDGQIHRLKPGEALLVL
jgi:hypothetical protein